MSEELFKSRWELEDLKLIDPQLHEALTDQIRMLHEHEAAMKRGWAQALRRMEDAEIARAKQAYPGARPLFIREKTVE